MSSRRVRTLSARALYLGGLAALLAGSAEPVLAQTPRSPRGFRGLFGGSSDETTQQNETTQQKLDATVALTAAYDSDVSEDVLSAGVGGLESVGHSTMLTTNAEYAWQGHRVQIHAGGTSSLRHYQALDEIQAVSHTVAVGGTGRLPGRISLSLNQTAAYTPVLFNLFAPSRPLGIGEAPPASPDYAVPGTESYAYETTLKLSRELANRDTISVTGDLLRTDVPRSAEGMRDLSVHGITGDYARRVRRNLQLTAAYRYRGGDLGQGPVVSGASLSEHSVEIGANYRWPLSASRQLTLGLGVGLAALTLPEQQVASVRRQPYSPLGNVAFGYQFWRTMQVRGTYRKSVEYVAGLPQPIAAEGITAELGGLLSRRLDVLAMAGYSSGESVWNPNTNTYATYTGAGRLRYALKRSLALQLEYLYYFYNLRGTVSRPDAASHFERHGARAGVVLYIPALRRVSRATR